VNLHVLAAGESARCHALRFDVSRRWRIFVTLRAR
jgi:hypothetical protein